MSDYTYVSRHSQIDTCAACGSTELECEWTKYMTEDDEELVFVCKVCGHTHRHERVSKADEDEEEA